MAANQTKKPQFKNPYEQGEKNASFKDVAVGETKQFLGDFAQSALEGLGIRKPLSGKIELASGTQKKEVQLEKKVQFLQRVNQEQAVTISQETRTTQKTIESLLAELRSEVVKFHAKTAELSGVAKTVNIDQAPPKAGVYHVNFFRWVLKSLKELRQKVGESRMWLATWQQKKQKKGFWANAKKKGSNALDIGYMFHEERGVAMGNA